MWFSKVDQVIPIAGAAVGGLIIGVIARNGFVNWTGETLVAGVLGLGGGAFALIAARNTTLRNEAKAAYRFSKNLSVVAPAILNAAKNSIESIEHVEAFPDEQLPEQDYKTLGYRLAMIIRDRVLKEITPPVENAPVDIQIAFDRVKTVTGVYLNPEDQNSFLIDNSTAVKWLKTLYRELGTLHALCQNYTERLSDIFKESRH